MRMRSHVSIPLAAALMMSVPAVASAEFPHVIDPRESLSSVASTDGLSVEALAAANGLPPDAWLYTGNTLMIPPQTTGTAGIATGVTETVPSTPVSAEAGTGASADDGDMDGDDLGAGPASGAAPVEPAVASSGAYVVQPGDTLSAIAARAGTTVAALAADNEINPNAPLLAGAVLRLGGSSAEDAQGESPGSQAAPASTSQPVGVAAEGSAAAPPYTTVQTVTPSEVGSIAAENGVPPSLAEAVANQESGFNNELTSSADARGVMQILPGTWNYINEDLAGPTPLEPASAASNVRGGVLLLHSLLESTGDSPSLAAAGYYQGLPSVLEDGEFPSTKQYVENVLALQQQFAGE
jgi:N-acetylmuramoyl-L-alanine amidase